MDICPSSLCDAPDLEGLVSFNVAAAAPQKPPIDIAWPLSRILLPLQESICNSPVPESRGAV